MLWLVVVLAGLAASDAMVCFHGICDKMEKKPAPVCKGSIIKNGGFCGCYDVCSKQEDETCQASFIRGRIPLGTCDKGLTCQHQDHLIIGAGKCVKDNKKARSTDNPTLCQKRRIQSMIVMVVYKGQWFPRCDQEGLYMPKQCDNTGSCFCVDVNTGEVDLSSKVGAGVDLSCSATANSTPTDAPTPL